MTNRETMQQALKCIERCNKHGWILADYEDEVYAAITALREALAQPERRKPLTNKEIWQMVNDCTIGGDLHADKFARAIEAALSALKAALEQPEQEPVAFYHPNKGFYWAKPTHISAPAVVDVPPLPLYTAPPAAAQPKQETQCKWPTCQNEEYQNTLAEQLKQELVTGRPWQSLTEEDLDYLCHLAYTGDEEFALAVQAKLKERNK